ncbi:hypothetical protein FKM82_019121 [Ascaphus truei]
MDHGSFTFSVTVARISVHHRKRKQPQIQRASTQDWSWKESRAVILCESRGLHTGQLRQGQGLSEYLFIFPLLALSCVTCHLPLLHNTVLPDIHIPVSTPIQFTPY